MKLFFSAQWHFPKLDPKLIDTDLFRSTIKLCRSGMSRPSNGLGRYIPACAWRSPKCVQVGIARIRTALFLTGYYLKYKTISHGILVLICIFYSAYLSVMSQSYVGLFLQSSKTLYLSISVKRIWRLQWLRCQIDVSLLCVPLKY